MSKINVMLPLMGIVGWSLCLGLVFIRLINAVGTGAIVGFGILFAFLVILSFYVYPILGAIVVIVWSD